MTNIEDLERELRETNDAIAVATKQKADYETVLGPLNRRSIELLEKIKLDRPHLRRPDGSLIVIPS